MRTAIRPARETDRALIANIFNLYQHEFSAYSDEFTFLDENGYFAADSAEEILPFGAGVFPYIITVDGRNAGLVLVLGAPYALPGCDWELAEIFVVRAARGSGAAREAVRLALEGRPGRWGLSVYENNARARAFWAKALNELNAPWAQRPSRHENMVDLFFDWTK